MPDPVDLAGRTVLITGASRGIGYFTALETARRGGHVIAIARTVGGLEELDDEIKALGGEATLVPLDLADADAIDRLGAVIFERWGHLDSLIGNAAMLGSLTPVSHIAPKEFGETFAINVTANYRLLRSMDLLLRQAPAGRVVFVSSLAARSRQPYWGLYAATKAALEALAKSYAGEMATTKVRTNVFYPGAVRTAMRAKAMPGEDPDTLPHPRDIAPRLVDLVMPGLGHNGELFDATTSTWSAL